MGRTPRSTVATYTGFFDEVRRLFARTEAATERGFGAGTFSFNTGGGRCPTCEGEGSVTVELLFLPGVRSPCTVCGGTRYVETGSPVGLPSTAKPPRCDPANGGWL